jgi:hypothetical protein
MTSIRATEAPSVPDPISTTQELRVGANVSVDARDGQLGRPVAVDAQARCERPEPLEPTLRRAVVVRWQCAVNRFAATDSAVRRGVLLASSPQWSSRLNPPKNTGCAMSGLLPAALASAATTAGGSFDAVRLLPMKRVKFAAILCGTPIPAPRLRAESRVVEPRAKGPRRLGHPVRRVVARTRRGCRRDTGDAPPGTRGPRVSGGARSCGRLAR